MTNRDEQSIEKRLNNHDFRKLSFSFQKLPILMFKVMFVNDGVMRSCSLMLLTQKQLLSLKCKHDYEYGPGVETLTLNYAPKTRFGVDTGALCEFIVTNIPSKHMPYLRRNVHQIEQFMEASKINFHKSAVSTYTRKDMKEVNRHAVTLESIRKADSAPVRIDQSGHINLTKEQEVTLRRIVRAVGKDRWEEVTKLLVAVHDYVDCLLDGEELHELVSNYYQLKLDPDLAAGFFTEDEDKCIIYMYKYWHRVMDGEEDNLWKHIARHMHGRTAQQVKNRFLRTTQNPSDLTLENILKYPGDPTNPATFNNDHAHAFSLTVVPKTISPDMEITTKLQHEVRFLVMGTMNEIFLVPVKDTAIRCSHTGMIHNNFTYDPTRPPQQFVTYIKLTFTNGLKKAGLIENPNNFHFSDIVYKGDGIHQLMTVAENERFIVPKEEFMALNRKKEGDTTTEMVLPLKRKYVKKIDKVDHVSQRLKVKIQPPSAKRRLK